MSGDRKAVVVPVVNLLLAREDVVATIRKACTDVGFFQVINHGVDPALIKSAFEQSRAFFTLPLESKLKYLVDRNNRGYTPLGEQTLDPSTQTQPDTKEGYYIGREVAPDSPEASMPLYGPNQWPDPALLPSWRPILYSYLSAMLTLGRRVTDLLGAALGLPDGYFQQPGMFDSPIATLRLLHYSAVHSSPSDGILAAGAHCDWGMLTLLVTDGVDGLQICLNKDGPKSEADWIDVKPREGAFVVNLGDMLERWSNHVFRSTLHRVATSGETERYSIPFFLEPNFDCRVECLPQCCNATNPPRYPPATCGKIMLDKIKRTHTKGAATKEGVVA